MFISLSKLCYELQFFCVLFLHHLQSTKYVHGRIAKIRNFLPIMPNPIKFRRIAHHNRQQDIWKFYFMMVNSLQNAHVQARGELSEWLAFTRIHNSFQWFFVIKTNVLHVISLTCIGCHSRTSNCVDGNNPNGITGISCPLWKRMTWNY